jgi:homoserine dehydrogenase
MNQKTVKVGIVGFGTVGAGVAKILLEDAAAIEAKTGIKLELAKVVDKDLTTKRPVELPQGVLTDDLDAIINDDSIDIAVEVIGGTTIACEIQKKLLCAGKDVVTANKALLAERGSELYAVAHENNRCIAFEASCAGGIPIVTAIRTGLAANRISAIYGILNGTCNYILSNMTEKGQQFDAALAQAQELGFAEADPTLDIGGGDSAHKLAILASIALGYEIKYESISVEGIETISADDIKFGSKMGYTLKLLAIAERGENGKISLKVHPAFIDNEDPLAKVRGSFNAVSIFADAAGHIMLYGRGAGMMPTASAVVADIIDVASGNSRTSFANTHLAKNGSICEMIEDASNHIGRYYIRLMAKDQAGVFMQIAEILSNNDISISGILQREGHGDDNSVPLVITTHQTTQKQLAQCINDLKELDCIPTAPACIRIVDIPEDKD